MARLTMKPIAYWICNAEQHSKKVYRKQQNCPLCHKPFEELLPQATDLLVLDGEIGESNCPVYEREQRFKCKNINCKALLCLDQIVTKKTICCSCGKHMLNSDALNDNPSRGQILGKIDQWYKKNDHCPHCNATLPALRWCPYCKHEGNYQQSLSQNATHVFFETGSQVIAWDELFDTEMKDIEEKNDFDNELDHD